MTASERKKAEAALMMRLRQPVTRPNCASSMLRAGALVFEAPARYRRKSRRPVRARRLSATPDRNVNGERYGLQFTQAAHSAAFCIRKRRKNYA